ncbi:hypothetical protein HYU96_01315 [Candidatus Daviesbacteria bacterium]|nr:hypothetical protein [Candidatus Daviesbacteria bacterium]
MGRGGGGVYSGRGFGGGGGDKGEKGDGGLKAGAGGVVGIPPAGGLKSNGEFGLLELSIWADRTVSLLKYISPVNPV